MAQKKMVIIATHAAEDPDRATIPFVMGNAALASDTDVTIILQSVGVMLAVKDFARHVHAESFPPLDELIKSYSELGGKLMACTPCLKARKITEEMLIAGTRQVAAGTVVSEATSADATLTY